MTASGSNPFAFTDFQLNHHTDSTGLYPYDSFVWLDRRWGFHPCGPPYRRNLMLALVVRWYLSGVSEPLGPCNAKYLINYQSIYHDVTFRV